MILLFEGLDKTGKTTVATQLSEDLKIPLHRFGVPPDDPEDCWWYFFGGLQKALRENTHLILDRFHLSHQVYGGRFGGAVLAQDQCWGLDKLLGQHQNSWLFLMVDRPHPLHERIQQEETFEPVKALSVSDLGKMQNEFFTLASESAITHKSSYKFPDFFADDRWTPVYEMVRDRLRRAMWNEEHGVSTY